MNMLIRLLLGALLVSASPMPAQAGDSAGSAFTYQGSLEVDGIAAEGRYEFEFELFNAPSGPSALGAPLTRNVAVERGVFVATLDFGDAPFSGSAVWLEVRLRPEGSTDPFETLLPRQAITAVPYAIHAQYISANAVTGGEIADGSIGAADIDPSAVQRRISAACPAGQAIGAVDQNGSVSCLPAGEDDDWLPLDDGTGRLQASQGIRVQPSSPTPFPFTVRHDSAPATPTAALTESEPGDAARLNFYNDSDQSRFWTVEGLIAGSVTDDRWSVRNSATGGSGAEILSVDGEGRVGVMAPEPLAALHVRSASQFGPDVGEGRGDLYIGDGTVGLSMGVALGGGGRGTSRLWTNTQGAIVLGNTSQDVMSVGFNGDRVGIGVNLPMERLHVAGGNVRIDTLAHVGASSRVVVADGNGVLATEAPQIRRKILSSRSFHPNQSDYVFIKYASSISGGSGPATFNALLELPRGARLISMEVNYYDDDGANDLSIQLNRYDPDGSFITLASFLSSGNSPENRQQLVELSPAVEIDNDAYTYQVFAGADLWEMIRLRNVVITYEH
ncbi:hypothetical protein [Pseudomarimonas salicorniae]|uniref:Uncharacterized protein n=1 Tax=Pseudomarimonas salicorniae TaxID=2933270 RepID=A0ABT0GF63_9GAMM|nr:hypothetical protein [Lysobacter sp. CAU 1642]MCK7593068.1 hypothetical protein [Lysobacter sp. CAU 1642]